MLRLIMKLIGTIPALMIFILNVILAVLLWDVRPMNDAGRAFGVVWSDNETLTTTKSWEENY